jgi:uncharacterized protein (DUF111 family)
MTITGIGVGAGGRDIPGRPNVVRLVIGETSEPATAAPAQELAREPALLIETNVDDLDPRLWPDVLTTLLEAGAADAWLTPVLMKKGRPAHTLSVLLAPELAPAIHAIVFRWTSTLGVREVEVTKRPLARDVRYVDVAGERVAVKRGFLPDGSIATVQPEHRDVAAAAAALGLAPREVLARAAAAARRCD